MPKFEQPKPYSSEEQAEIKEELERQADEQRKEAQSGATEKLPEEKEEFAPEKPSEKLEEKPEGKAEKTKEQLLSEARENFARVRVQLDKNETLKTVKKFKGELLFNSVKSTDLEIIEKYFKQIKQTGGSAMIPEEIQIYSDALTRRNNFQNFFRANELEEEQINKMYLDAIAHNGTKEKYQEAMRGVRSEMYEKALDEIEELGLSKDQAGERLRQKMEEIVKTTVVGEANNLYDSKTKMSLEAKGDAGFAEKSWKTAGKAVEWYRKLPLKYKLMVSAGLLAGGVAAGAAGGATGAALAAGVVTGRWFQRVFGGAATAVGLEGFIKRSQEKQAEKKTFEEFGDKLSEMIENNDKSLDERLFELEGKKKSEKTRRYILAGTAGAVVASGLLGRVIRWGIEETGIGKSIKESVTGWFEHKGPSPELAVSHGPGYVPQEALEHPSYEGYEAVTGGPQIAGKGDSVWKIIGRQMSDRYGEKFNNLDEARKTYLIDALKDKVAADPEKFGITNVDQIEAGKTYDFLPGSRIEVEELMDKAKTLEEGITSQIAEHDKMIEDWVKAHPGESLTTEKVDEILFGGKIETSDLGEYEKTVSVEQVGTSAKIPDGEVTIEPEKLPGQEVAGTRQPLEGNEFEPQAREAMAYNEMNQVRAIGYSQPEYQTVRNIKVNVFLREFPPRYQAWDTWRMNPNYHHYSPFEYRHHVRAAEIIRGYEHHHRGIGHMRVGRFFQTYGPRRFPIPFPPPSPPPFGRPF